MVEFGNTGDPPKGAIPKGSTFILPWDKTLLDYEERGAYLVPKEDKKHADEELAKVTGRPKEEFSADEYEIPELDELETIELE